MRTKKNRFDESFSNFFTSKLFSGKIPVFRIVSFFRIGIKPDPKREIGHIIYVSIANELRNTISMKKN